MARRRRVVLLAVAAVAFLTATSGYTAVTGERAIGVGVVDDDDDAYVGFVDAEPTVTAGGDRQTTVLEVQNRFGATATVRVTATDPAGPVDLSLTDRRLSVASGATVSVQGRMACDGSVDAPVSVTVPVTLSVDSDTGVRAEIDREVTVRCEPPRTETESDADDDADATGEETAGGAESDELDNETESGDDGTDDEAESDDEETDDEGETGDEDESDDGETDKEADGEEETDDEAGSDDETDQTEA